MMVVASLVSRPAFADPKEDAANRKIMHAYARCVVKARHDRAAKAIVGDESNGAILKQYPDLIDSDCMGTAGGGISMSFAGDLYRYALADALVSTDFAASGPADFSDRLPLSHILPPDQKAFDQSLAGVKSRRRREELQQQFDRGVAVNWLSRYGECVARADPAGTRLWLLTPSDVPEENSRINALRPAFGSCLAGGTMTFTKIVMRGTVALNYYRLAVATSVPAIAGKAN